MLRWITNTGIVLGFLAGTVANGEVTAPVRVVLRPEAVVGNELVKTADVANVVGGDLATRERIAKLDIIERGSSRIGTVTKSQVALRLRLAGISPNWFQVTGPDLAVIRWEGRDDDQPPLAAEPRGDQPIIEMIQAALVEIWHVPSDDIVVRLSRPLPLSMRQLWERDSSITIKPFLPKSSVPGPVRLSCGAYREGTLVQQFAVTVETDLIRQVAVAVRNIDARAVLSQEDVRIERQPTSGRVANQAVTDVVGKVATHAIRKGDVFLATDVREVEVARTATAAVIKRGDLVRLIARGHGLTVSVRSCEALENGRPGEAIRIRNLTSNKTVVGRVVRPGEVEITL